MYFCPSLPVCSVVFNLVTDMLVDVDVILDVGGTVDVGVVVDVKDVVNSVVVEVSVLNKTNKLLDYALEIYIDLV